MFMEKTTKKRKSKKGLRKRIGIIAVGGLSLVLTVCLSVGATLAWFAGSTWASKDLYMGGPVYVEMAGRGLSQGTEGDGDGGQTGTDADKAEWVGGYGNLDIEAAATRQSGTGAKPDDVALSDILLPGQKVQIYSQARVFSTAATSSLDDGETANLSSGANTVNTSNGTATYKNQTGRVTTTTTSVLRARFSIEVQFDPTVGFNNFTAGTYAGGYPEQHKAGFAATLGHPWDATKTDDAQADGALRDGVATGTWTADTDATACAAIRDGSKKSIYQWRYCSQAEWNNAGDYKMAAPFDGGEASKTANNGIPFYGVWVEVNGAKAESDAYYKARCNAYLGTYKEYYVNEYGNTVTRTVASSVKALENKLNEYFVKLVNDSSDAIKDGHTAGFTVSDVDGQVTRAAGTAVNASWLYIDPSIGNDTNTDEISTSVGGWWYLVADNGKDIGGEGDNANKIRKATDSVKTADAATADSDEINTITYEAESAASITRASLPTDDSEGGRLDAMLYEIVPDLPLGEEVIATNGDEEVTKVVSDAFPFVNGSFALPADALTNIFANAKITFKIAFQAMQAFFPYTESIDKVDYKDALLGTAKALSIRNAIPIFNEAFDYQEVDTVTGGIIPGL